MNVTDRPIDVARFDRLVVVTRGTDQLALTHAEASELLRLLSGRAVAERLDAPTIPPAVEAIRDFLGGKERAQGAPSIQRQLRAGGFLRSQDAGYVGRLLDQATASGWIRTTGSGRYALP
jgi:hypothetical protein